MKNCLDHSITCRTWQICSPDLTPLNLFLLETLTGIVYQDVPTTLENMWQHIDKCARKPRPDLFQNILKKELYQQPTEISLTDTLNPQVTERSRQTLIK
jgi:hypothetical protein